MIWTSEDMEIENFAFFCKKMRNDVIYDDVMSQNDDKKSFFYKIFKLHMTTMLCIKNKLGSSILSEINQVG